MNAKNIVVALIGIIFSTTVFTQIASANLLVKPANLGVLRLDAESFPYIITKSFIVGNTYDYPINIELGAERNMTSLIQLEETSFILQPHENRTINYTITLLGPGSYEGGISVQASGSSNQASIAYEAELRIIANQAESSEPQLTPEIFMALALVAAFAIAFVLMRGGKKRKMLFASIFLSLFFVSSARAADVALVVLNSQQLDQVHEQKVHDILTQMGHSVFLVDSSTTVDYTNFDLIVVVGSPSNTVRLGPFAKDIPVNDIPTIAIDASYIDDWGWVKPSGISILYSSATQKFFVYREHPITQGLPVGQKVNALTIAGKNLVDLVSSNSKLRAVATVNSDANLQLVSYAGPKTQLFNGKQVSNQSGIVYFGIPYSVYWTTDTEKLFKNAVNWLLNMEFGAPTTPILSGPASSKSKIVQYNWTASSDVSGIQYYQFQLSTTPDFSDDIIIDVQTTSLQYTANNLAVGKKYYARVRAFDWFDVPSEWSNIVSTVIDNTNIIITIIEPKPNINLTLGQTVFTKVLVQATLALQDGCSFKIGSESIGTLPYDTHVKTCSGNVTVPTTLGQNGVGNSQFTASATNVLGTTNSSSIPVFFDRSLRVTVATGQSSYTSESLITASGSVTLADNNAKVSGATVSYSVPEKSISGSTTTNSNGVYSISFSNPGKGSYTLQVTAEYDGAKDATASTSFTVSTTTTTTSRTSEVSTGGGSSSVVLMTIGVDKSITGYESEDVNFNVNIKNDGNVLLHGVKVQLKDIDFSYETTPASVDLAASKAQNYIVTLHIPDLSEGTHEFRIWGISRETDSFERTTLEVLPKKVAFIKPIRIELPIFDENVSASVNLTVENTGTAASDLTVTLEVPEGWKIEQDSITSSVDANQQKKFVFFVTPSSNNGELNFLGVYTAGDEEKNFMQGTNVTVRMRKVEATSPFTSLVSALQNPMILLPIFILMAILAGVLLKTKKVKIPSEKILLPLQALQKNFPKIFSKMPKKEIVEEESFPLFSKPRKINLASNYAKWERKYGSSR